MSDAPTPGSRLTPVLVFVGALALFVLRAAPGVTFGDAGELAAATVSLGVAHPPGYPLQVLVGNLWVRALGPFVDDPARALVLFSVVTAAGAAAVLAGFVAARGGRPGAAAATGLLLLLAPTFASQAVVVEVYAPAALLQAGVLALAFAERQRPGLTLFTFGLALVAHPSSIALAPVALFALLACGPDGPSFAARSVRGGLGLVLGLAPFLAVPLLARRDPAVNWGEAASGDRLLDHLLRTQYATGLERAWENQLGLLAEQLVGQWPLVVAAAVVTLIAFRRQLPARAVRRLLLALAFASAVLLLAVNWPLADELSRARVAASYLPLVLLSCAVVGLALVGVERALLARTSPVVPAIGLPLGVLLLALPLGPTTLADDVDASEDRWAAEYATTVLGACPPNAVLVVSKLGHGDDLWFPLLYFQVARGHRTDVLALPRELLEHPWYREQLARREPWLTPALANLEARFEAVDPAALDPRARRLLTAGFFGDLAVLAERLDPPRPVVFVAKPGERLLAGRRAVPGPALWHFAKDGAPSGSDAFDWLPSPEGDPVLELLLELAADRRRARQ